MKKLFICLVLLFTFTSLFAEFTYEEDVEFNGMRLVIEGDKMKVITMSKKDKTLSKNVYSFSYSQFKEKFGKDPREIKGINQVFSIHISRNGGNTVFYIQGDNSRIRRMDCDATLLYVIDANERIRRSHILNTHKLMNVEPRNLQEGKGADYIVYKETESNQYGNILISIERNYNMNKALFIRDFGTVETIKKNGKAVKVLFNIDFRKQDIKVSDTPCDKKTGATICKKVNANYYGSPSRHDPTGGRGGR